MLWFDSYLVVTDLITLYCFVAVEQGHRLCPVLGHGLVLHPQLHHGLRLHPHLLRRQGAGAAQHPQAAAAEAVPGQPEVHVLQHSRAVNTESRRPEL